MTGTVLHQDRHIARDGADASRQLHRLIEARDALRPEFEATWAELVASRSHGDMDIWSRSVMSLLAVNASAMCLMAYWKLSRALPREDSIAILATAADATAVICSHAGSRAATASLSAFPIARRLLAGASAVLKWWQALETLSAQAPEAVEAVTSQAEIILSSGDVTLLEDFIAAGFKLGARDKRKRLAFFMLEDETARRILNRSSNAAGFAEVEQVTKAFVLALWGRSPLLRRLSTDSSDTGQRRTSIAGPLIRMPEVYRGVEVGTVRALYRASAAHAQAHLVLGSGRFRVAKLKPLQIALVTLIEDARIETLAMRQFPGLRRLWSPYHVAIPSGMATAPSLLARLARALFDRSYVDDDNFVSKGRAMFAESISRLADPAISREIGTLLGNDLGQMRVQFNAKTYVVEPIYRDDGLGLWDFSDDSAATTEIFDLPVDAVRLSREESLNSDSEQKEEGGKTGETRHAKPVASIQSDVVIATYPEWDRAHGLERPDWTTVREITPRIGDPAEIDHALDGAIGLRTNIKRLVNSVRVGRATRLKRQFEGHDLDLDSVIEAGICIATSQEPDPRVFRSSVATQRDLAVLVLVDVSRSTADRLRSGGSILDVEKLAVAALAEAMTALRDPFGILAFASNGRDDVEMTTIKDFGESYGRVSRARLAGLKSDLSTRLGAALRHAGTAIGAVRSFRKLVIVLTDGEPSDIDVADPRDLVEDARRAALGLRLRGIDGYGVVLDSSGMNAAAKIFGRGNTMLVHRVEDLPSRLSQLYFRLARR